MSNQERGTGRSQRDIVRALSQAMMGKRVLFVSMTPESGRAHWQVACDWLEANGFVGYSGCSLLPLENTIRLGVGHVLFSMGQSLSGPQLHCIQHIVEDHFVTECKDAKAEKDRIVTEIDEDKNTIAKLMRKHQWLCVEGYGPQFHGGNAHKCKVRLNLNQRAPE